MHPALRLLELVLLAMLVQFLSPTALALVGMLVTGGALRYYGRLFVRTLRRSRWLLITLLLIYSFTTPGEFIHGWPINFAPTYEGLESGLMQSARLVTMLAGLSILLGSTGQEDLMAGIFVLLHLLRYVGVSAERFTARLWLTLEYVEQAPANGEHWRGMMEELNGSDFTQNSRQMDLRIPAYTWRDGMVVIVTATGLLIWAAL